MGKYRYLNILIIIRLLFWSSRNCPWENLSEEDKWKIVLEKNLPLVFSNCPSKISFCPILRLKQKNKSKSAVSISKKNLPIRLSTKNHPQKINLSKVISRHVTQVFCEFSHMFCKKKFDLRATWCFWSINRLDITALWSFFPNFNCKVNVRSLYCYIRSCLT